VSIFIDQNNAKKYFHAIATDYRAAKVTGYFENITTKNAKLKNILDELINYQLHSQN
jgi:hypothetical protein